ncbi:MAG: hypothetical protein DDT34_01354 [Firmicutes bacterium]|nr:hypothetical protein [Bacillota bacterium]
MEKFFGKNGAKSSEDAEHWIGVSDLMSGLMIVFMFIAVSYMAYVHFERERIREIAVSNQEAQLAIYKALNDEFQGDLSRWGASIGRETLEFRFGSPEVLFVPGSSELRPQFRQTLHEFFPRYVKVLENFKADIEEIRIEGHTSSDWGGITGDAAYFRNMALAQDRTRAALEYVQTLQGLSVEQREWTRRTFAAIGYSSSRSILDPDTGLEDKEKSRRVNFRVLTEAEVKLRTIVEQLRADQN